MAAAVVREALDAQADEGGQDEDAFAPGLDAFLP
jgi:hypothetical protein